MSIFAFSKLKHFERFISDFVISQKFLPLARQRVTKHLFNSFVLISSPGFLDEISLQRYSCVFLLIARTLSRSSIWHLPTSLFLEETSNARSVLKYFLKSETG